MQIRPVNVFDDRDLERFHELTERADAFERPFHSGWSLDDAKLKFRRQDPIERGEAWAAYVGDSADGAADIMVGGASVWFSLMDNLTKCWGELGVDPAHRRKGVGSALIAQIVTRMRQQGRTTIVVESAYPIERRQDHPYRRFAEANGFTVSIDEIARVLPLPIRPGLLQTLAAEASPHHTAYRIESFTGDLPDELLASYCTLSNQLGVDAPTGDLDFEADSMSPQLWLERVAAEKEIGRVRFTTLAIDASGTGVAYTDLIVPPEPSPDVWQWGTLVHREHRGHRLGMAVKVRNLQRLAAADTCRARVLTSNAETNSHMVDINARLGFEAIEVRPMFELRLDDGIATPAGRSPQVRAATS